jgi:hypothetical protein
VNPENLPGVEPDRMLALVRDFGVVLAVLGALAGPAAAQSGSELGGSGSAALGVGMFGDKPATSLDLGIDFEAGDLALGIGGRVRWLAGEGVRDEDWNDPSEIATALRYLSYRRAPRGRVPGVALAAGALADVRLGHGSIVGGYTSGLDVDHRRLGAQARVAGERYRVDGMIDDVVAPRIVGGHGRWSTGGRASFGATFAGDIDAGAPMASVDAELAFAHGTPYADLVGIADGGAGVHAGVRFDEATSTGTRFLATLEARAGTGDYVPAWVGPLYEVDRIARDAGMIPDGLGGIGGLVEAGVDVPEVGTIATSYAVRRGLPDQATVRARAPYYRGVQAGLWGAAEIRRGGERAIAAEVRAQLPHGLFAVADAARLYRDAGGMLEPVWIATVAFGSALAF